MFATRRLRSDTIFPRLFRSKGTICSVHSQPFASKTGTDNSAYVIESSMKADMYLHVGPSGDFWTGHSIFAAKHLQPDYVKSVRLDESIDVDELLELLEDLGDDCTQLIYDKGEIPERVIDQLMKATKKFPED